MSVTKGKEEYYNNQIAILSEYVHGSEFQTEIYLETNLRIEGETVNGALDTTKVIIWDPSLLSPALPQALTFEFDDYDMPFLTEILFYVT